MPKRDPDPPPRRTLSVEVAGERVRYRVLGTGPPLVLVHGLYGSLRWWSRNLAALAADHRVFVLNVPRFGMFLRRRGRLDLREGPTLLRAFMEQVGLARATFVGHSMGATVCLRTAARHPEVVDRLVLVAPAGMPPARSRPGHVRPLLDAGRLLRPRVAATIAADAVRARPVALWRVGSMLLAEDVRDDLARIRAPTLIVWGERDTLVDVAGARAFQEAIPGSRLLLMPDTGHVPMAERPAQWNEAVLGFLAGEPVGEAPG